MFVASPALPAPPRRRAAGGGIGLALVVVLAAGCGKTEPSPAGDPAAGAAGVTAPDARAREAVRAEGHWVHVRRGHLQRVLQATGSFRAAQITMVASQVAGRVREVLVKEGDVVRRGQELVHLDSTLLGIELDQRKAAVARAEAGLESLRQHIRSGDAEIVRAEAALKDADLQWNRMRNLWEKPEGDAPSIPRKLYDDAMMRREQAAAALGVERSERSESEARLREAEVGMKETREAERYAEERLREAVIVAPYDGSVVRRFVHPGEMITSTPVVHLLELQETTALHLDFPLPQTLISRVKEGTAVRFRVDGTSRNGAGKVAVVLPQVDERTRSFWCRIVIDNADGAWRPGLLAQVEVDADPGASERLLVPTAALARVAGGWQVQASNDDHPKPRTVHIGEQTAEETEILEGLADTDRVWVATGGNPGEER